MRLFNVMDIGMGTRLALSKLKNDSKTTDLQWGFRQCFTSMATYTEYLAVD